MNHRRIFITRQDRERLTTMLDEALAAKRHLGAPLGLDFAALAARAKKAEAWAGAERKRYAARRNQLLGLKAVKSPRAG